MQGLREKLFRVVAECFYSPAILPEYFWYNRKKYWIRFTREEDQEIVVVAYIYQGKNKLDQATLCLKHEFKAENPEVK